MKKRARQRPRSPALTAARFGVPACLRFCARLLPRPVVRAALLGVLVGLLPQLASSQVRADWVRRLDNNWRDDRVVGMAVDRAGNCWITGFTASVTGDYDMVTVKYRPDGYREWTQRYGTPGSDDRAAAIASDAAGNVYVAGRTGQDRTSGVVIRYDSAGTERWARQITASDSSPGVIDLAAVDEAGMIIAAGWTGVAPDLDVFTAKLDSAGEIVWTRRYAGAGLGPDQARAMALDSSGDVYLAGQCCPTSASGDSADLLTLKYDRNGNEQWSARWAGAGVRQDVGGGIAVDRDGAVFVGAASSVGGAPDSAATIVVVKYTPHGETLWTRSWRGTGSGRADARAVVIDPEGAIYVAGTSAGAGTGPDFTLLKYEADGARIWAHTLDRDSGPDELAAAIGDRSGSVYLTGRSWSSGSGFDFLTACYRPSGETAWTVRYDRSWSSDGAGAVATHDAEAVYVAGTSWDDYSGDDFAAIKYLQASGQQEVPVRSAVGLPPVRATRNVLYYQGREPAAVCDISGRRLLRVRTGANDVHGMPPGVYILTCGSAGRGHKFVVR